MTRTSAIWLHFVIVDKATCIARCNACSTTISFRTTLTNLKKHLQRKHKDLIIADVDTSIQVENQDGALGQASLSQHAQQSPEKRSQNHENDNTNSTRKYAAVSDPKYTRSSPFTVASSQFKTPNKQSKTHNNQFDASSPQFDTSNRYLPAPNIEAKEDEYDMVGKNIAAKLRKMNFHQRVLAESLMQQVLTKGLFDELTRNTVIEELSQISIANNHAKTASNVDNSQNHNHQNDSYTFIEKFDEVEEINGDLN